MSDLPDYGPRPHDHIIERDTNGNIVGIYKSPTSTSQQDIDAMLDDIDDVTEADPTL
jgi:hypothetical protein